LDVDWFRLQLKDFEDSEIGMAMPDTHRHNAQIVLAGVTYARSVEVLAPYTVEFEDGIYEVVCVGANHNLSDRKVVNSVSLIVGNSAGLIVVADGGGGGSCPTAGEIAAAVLAAMNTTPPGVDVKKVNGTSVAGSGVPGTDPWRPA